MGLVLGMPLTTFLVRILTEPILLLKTWFLYVWLRCFSGSRRFDLYESLNKVDLTRNGVTIPPLEHQLDQPEQNLEPKTCDTVLIYGGNTTGDRLLARVSRQTEGHVSWLYLRLADGRSYQPTCQERDFPPSGNFAAGGLRIKCRLSMRVWRVSFNGLLKESKDGESETKVVHVKFSFLCTTSSYPFDLSTDIHPAVMADYLAREKELPILSRQRSARRYLESFVQSLSLLGTVSVDGCQEMEVFMWGARKRSRENRKHKRSSRLTEFFGYSKDGQLIYTGEYVLPGSKSILPFAFYLERSSLSGKTTNLQQTFSGKQSSFNGMQIAITTDRSFVSASVEAPFSSLEWRVNGHQAKCHLTKFKLQDGDFGHGVLIESSWTPTQTDNSENSAWRLLLPDYARLTPTAPTMSLGDPCCQDPIHSGGKGASLAALTGLTARYTTDFKVPGGFVVSTQAYGLFYATTGVTSSVAQLQKEIWSYGTDKIKVSCSQLVAQVSKTKVPDVLQHHIRKQIIELYTTGFSNLRFAVRSSASGEDSEEMSAAGQMSTLLGVQGFDNICEAIVKCWASQFSFTAIQYKRQNGQELNSPMAVVVQEMVAADKAGVLFTCDPVTGNPQNVTITANYGLGESVVSASADPDTVVLRRDEHNQVVLQSINVGKKTTKIVMTEAENVLEENVNESDAGSCCLSEENAMAIAQAGLKIEEAYGFPVDIEWAIKDNQLYMLQARPVTTFDLDTRFEVTHAVSVPLRAEDEYNTKANVGEVMPGFLSQFGASQMTLYFIHCLGESYNHRNKYAFPYNPYLPNMVFHQNHAFISMPGFILRFYKKGTKSFLAEANQIAGFGRILEDQEMFDQADRRNRMYPTTFAPFQILYFIADMINGGRQLNSNYDKYWNQEIDLKKCKNSKEMFEEIWRGSFRRTPGIVSHLVCSMNSSILNSIAMGLLAEENKGWDVNVFNEFSMIVSSCGDLESADIPRSILVLVRSIRKSIDIQKFKEMPAREALDWLESTDTAAGDAYADFLKKHGHRCLKEFDVFSHPWRENKLPLIKTLQDTVSQEEGDEKTFIPDSEVVGKLKIPKTWKTKFILNWLVPLCRKGVFNREKSKSLSVKMFDHARRGFWILAEQLVKEGRLPEKDLMFFLSNHEVIELIETRSPSLIQRAIRRRQIYPEINKLKFPEITKGIPRPVNVQRNDYDDHQKSDLEIRGTPVSQGSVKAFCRVATDLEEAEHIQHGEILIAYSTDIAWSPYFPLLSGVATELGGLISHGAVVAREYGLPCVVGVQDATIRFKTGDYVLIDGNKGLLKRLEAPQK